MGIDWIKGYVISGVGGMDLLEWVSFGSDGVVRYGVAWDLVRGIEMQKRFGC